MEDMRLHCADIAMEKEGNHLQIEESLRQQQSQNDEEMFAAAEEDYEEEEEDDEKEGDFEDDEYVLRFRGEMDPFSFVEENDASGVQPYQKFQRLESEALAARRSRIHRDEDDQREVSKEDKQLELFGASMDEIMAAANIGIGRKRGKGKSCPKKHGGPKLSADLDKKLGAANLCYAKNQFDEAIELLKEVVRLAPNVPESYHTLALIYNLLGDKKKALNFYMIAAHLTPKDVNLWKRLAAMSSEQGNLGQVIYFLTKAMRSDPEDMSIQWSRAQLYVELKDYQKAAEAFNQIANSCPLDVEAHKMAAQMHKKNGQIQPAIECLEKFFTEHPLEGDLTVVNLLAALLIENKSFSKAIQQIEHARMIYCSGQGLPLDLAVKSGICYAYNGNLDEAERCFEDLNAEQAQEFSDLLAEVADAYMSLKHYELALKYFYMLEGTALFEDVAFWIKAAQCHQALEQYDDAIKFYYKVLCEMPDNIDVRLTLANVLTESDKLDDAIQLLSAPENTGSELACLEDFPKGYPWWLKGSVRKLLANIYRSQENNEGFVDVIVPAIKESLYYESKNYKVRNKKKLPKSVLFERMKVLDDISNEGNVFRGIRPILPSSEISKATRARKALAKRTARKEEQKAAALAAGLEWHSSSDEEAEVVPIKREVPLPNLLKDEEHYQLLIESCNKLASLKRYWEALEIINLSLKLANQLPPEKQEELRSLGAQYAYNTTDPKHGYDCVRYLVQQRPYNLHAWNCYYKVVSRLDSRAGKHGKFMVATRTKYPDCVPAMVICGHQFAMISQSQGALREYLEAYKLQPDNPLINLCVGTSLINLALGFRINNKNQCVVQGFAFLYNYQRLCNNSQESNYNLARAYHHVGLVTLAVTYYEKVLAHCEEDHPIPRLPHEDVNYVEKQPEMKIYGHCDLRKEAAYNLHLIYKKSGATDLARQLLKDYCST